MIEIKVDEDLQFDTALVLLDHPAVQRLHDNPYANALYIADHMNESLRDLVNKFVK